MKLVILAAPRTGSNLLCTLLQSHPDVLCHHELYNPTGIFTALPLRNSDFSLGGMEEREADPIGFLQRIWERHLGHNWVGFKMTLLQQPRVLASVCRDPDIFKIILKRRSRLKTYVSYRIAKRNNVWEDYGESTLEATAARPVFIDYDRLRASVDYNRKFYAGLDQIIEGPRIDLIYESLFEPFQQQQLLKALNLDAQPLIAQSRHQNPHELRFLISNYDQLFRQMKQDGLGKELLQELA